MRDVMTRLARCVLVAATLLGRPALRAQDTPASTRAKQDVLWSRMEDSIRRIAQETDAVIGVAIIDLTDQRSFFLHADEVFPTARTIKLAVLSELYRQNERATAGSAAGAKLGDLY